MEQKQDEKICESGSKTAHPRSRIDGGDRSQFIIGFVVISGRGLGSGGGSAVAGFWYEC